MHRNIARYTVLALLVFSGGFAAAQEKSASDPKYDADRAAIDTFNKSLVQAFENRDAAAMAGNWTEQGEFGHNDGDPLRGRTAIQRGYADFFKTLTAKFKVEIQSESVRFPAADMAVTEATLRLISDDGETIAAGRQSSVLVREGGQWKAAVMREWDRDIARDVALKDLEWLIGTWHAVSDDRELTITYEWNENRTFIRGTFTAKEGAKPSESGEEIITRDNADGVIRSWVFQSDGGFGEGAWTREGKRWNIDVHGVRADGRKLTATFVYIPADPNTITWQAVNQSIDGALIADTQPIKVTKQNAKTTAAAAAANSSARPAASSF
jgi:uncharacterized protein (TIGR02246 family)